MAYNAAKGRVVIIVTFSEKFAVKCKGARRWSVQLGPLLFFARSPLIMVVLFASWEEYGVGSGFFKCQEKQDIWAMVEPMSPQALNLV